jgi:hypothetical protein
MMVDPQTVQVFSGLCVAATPWIAVRTALAAAPCLGEWARQPVAAPRAFVHLGHATLMAFPIVGGVAVWLPAPSVWMAVVDGLAFAGLAALALRALDDLDNATRAGRFVESLTRVASLVARRSGQYLPVSWRAWLLGATVTGVALFVWRLSVTSPADRRVFVAVGFALIALVFLCLYEIWIHQLATGPTVADADDVDRTRRLSIRRVFVAEFILVTSFLALAHGLLDAHSVKSGWATVAELSGALLAVVGCGLALASDLSTRQYLVAPPR